MAVMKNKRGRGRPTKALQQLIELEDAQDKGKEIYGNAYVSAQQYIADVATGETPSTPQLRLQAARVIKEQVEAWLQEAYKEASAEDDSESDNEAPLVKVVNI